MVKIFTKSKNRIGANEVYIKEKFELNDVDKKLQAESDFSLASSNISFLQLVKTLMLI
jgi:hypothetical protein